MQFFIDGTYVERQIKTIPYGAIDKYVVVLPKLSVGTHTLKVLWDNVYKDTSLQIESMRLIKPEPAGEANGQDWLANRLDQLCRLDNNGAQVNSKVSPACIEGSGRYLNQMTLSDGLLPVRTAYNNFYVNVPLVQSATKTLDVSWQNAQKSQTQLISWEDSNILDGVK